jgi:hypothetical protein
MKGEAEIAEAEDTSGLSGENSARERGVTPRVVLLSLTLAVFFGYIAPIVDYKFRNTFLGANYLPAGGLAVLLTLVLVVNPLLKLGLRKSKWGFSRNEILTVYITCLFSCLVPGRGAENFFVPNVIASFYFATRENRWMDFLQPYLKPWMTPALKYEGRTTVYNQQVVEGWYVGLDGTTPIPWGAWTAPLIAWGGLIIALYAMLACLSIILRAQWAEREALSFPLLRLPLELTADVDHTGQHGIGRFFHNPLVWVGFGLAVCIEMLNGLHAYIPDIPDVPLVLDTRLFMTEAPWNQIGLTVLVWPIVVGVSYFLSFEISFSLWFFYWFTKFQLLALHYCGVPPGTVPSPLFTRGGVKGFLAYQQIGAYFAYVALILWIGREHYLHVVQRAFGRSKAGQLEQSEPLSYPVAFWGFVLTFLFLVGWTCAAGVRFDIALVLWSFYLILAIGLTRAVVEGGLLLVHTGWGPMGPMAHLFGGGVGAWFAPASAVPVSMINGAIMADMRGFLLPSFVQGFKLAHDRKIALKPLLALIMSATVVSLTVGVWMNVRLGYVEGGLKLGKWWAFGEGALAPAINAREIVAGIDDNLLLNWFFVGMGAVITYGMVVARSHFVWFPLHPVGYIMSTPYAMRAMWFSIFLGWLIKVLVTRFGGTDSYRRLMPAALGLILGEVVMILFWLCIDGWQGRTDHVLIP